jgi:hypothetical protein
MQQFPQCSIDTTAFYHNYSEIALMEGECYFNEGRIFLNGYLA